jgi:hypothetical protein
VRPRADVCHLVRTIVDRQRDNVEMELAAIANATQSTSARGAARARPPTNAR